MNLLPALIAAPLLFLSTPSIDLYRQPVHVCPSGFLQVMDRCVDQYDIVKYPYHRMLASHNYRVGRYWTNLKVGDKLRYNSRVYRVYDKQIVTPQDIHVLDADDDEIRMMTCVNGIQDRLIIYARSTRSVPPPR